MPLVRVIAEVIVLTDHLGTTTAGQAPPTPHLFPDAHNTTCGLFYETCAF